MKGVARTEFECYVNGGIRCDATHSASDEVFRINLKDCVFLKEVFEIYTIPVELDISEGELREDCALFILCLAWVKHERNVGAIVHHGGHNEVKLRGVCSGVVDITEGCFGVLTLEDFDLLCLVIVVDEVDVVADVVEEAVEILVPTSVELHQGGRRVLELATIGMRAEGNILYRFN
jgi:hypothetical protein